MQVHLRFRVGKPCSFIWVRRNADSQLVTASLAHEKYHAVCRLKPEAIDAVSARISELGFKVNLADFEEEYTEPGRILRMGIPPMRVEIDVRIRLGHAPGPGRDE